MKKNKSITGTNYEKYINLCLAALIPFYVVQVVLDLIFRNFCANLAVDYCAFWSAGYVAHHYGYEKIYDLSVLANVQMSLFPRTLDPGLFQTVPVPYIPVFIIPFQVLAFFKPFPGFVLWTIINLAVFIWYLYFFTNNLHGPKLPKRLFLMLFFSLPVFLDLFWGQVNLWLMICVGEYIRAMNSQKERQAGFWLAGLLLKPQLLFLIIPILIFRRSYKTLYGFVLVSIGLFVLSLGLAGVDGLEKLVQLWLGYTKGLPSNGPEIMMNWRMLMSNLNVFFPSFIGPFFVFAGTLMTLGLVYFIWRSPFPEASGYGYVALMGLFAATGAIAWHSHLSTSMILIPVFVMLHYQGYFPQVLFDVWVLLPPFVKMLGFLGEVLIKASVVSVEYGPLLNFSFGLVGLGLNIALVVWSVQRFYGFVGKSASTEI